MRALAFTLVLAVPAVAHAEGFLELAGGISSPIADSSWTKLADPSPELEIRPGSVGESGFGGMLQIGWTPVALDNPGGSFGTIANAQYAGHRFRILANAVLHKHIFPKLIASGRAGVGVDIAHGSASVNVLGNETHSSDTDAGFAFEFGGGLWFDLGSAQLGAELALPIGYHSKKGNGSDGNFTFDYTSTDIDILFGVRLLSR